MATTVESTRTGSALPELDLYRIGGYAGIIGGVLAIVANALHPRLSPSDLGDTEATLEMVAGYPLWRIDHFAILLSLVLGIVAFVALSRSITDLPAAAWSRIALVLGIATGAVAAVSFSIDGFVLSGLAEEWAAGERALALEAAATLELVDSALFSVTVIGLFGVTQFVFGVALRQSESYPKWIGIVAMIAGVAGFLSGTLMWLTGAIDVANFLVLFSMTSVLLAVWLLAASFQLLKKSRGAADLGSLQP